MAENDGEHHHGKKGPDEGPQYVDDSLLVADGDIAQGEYLKPPEVKPIVPLRSAGFDDDFVAHESNFLSLALVYRDSVSLTRHNVRRS
jgi:hypothetical protein